MNNKKSLFVIIFLSVTAFVLSCSLYGINTTDTRMLQQPAISENHIAFIYAEDLWVVKRDGTQPRRLTIDEGVESNPAFSPDGKLIAFSAEYDGNRDVFVVPVEGGVPLRLTWHPGPEAVQGFTPDGRNVLFTSQRNVFTKRYSQLFKVPITGGYPVQLEIPNASRACYSPDGKYMAYNPLGEAFREWKNYRGGTISTIWIYSFSDHSVKEIPKPEGGCNDTYPIWIGNNIYFLSDRNGEFNLFAYDRGSAEIRQLTNFDDFPVLAASGRDGTIAFEQAGFLHVFDLRKSESEKLTIGISSDLLELRPRFVRGSKYIRDAGISPTGARAVVDFRGEIITLPAEKGDPRNLTNTAGVHETGPEWSPDGKSIAYFSDASGENELHITPQDGKGETRTFKLDGTGFYAQINWSPNSKKISYVDNGRNLYVIEVDTGNVSKIDTDELYEPGSFRDMFGDWSFDSKWFIYTRVTDTHFKRAYLYSLEQQKAFALTDGLSDVSDPAFDRGGKYIYFLASTDAGPVVNWFDMSNADMSMTQSLYLVTLQKETISPFAKESDEETGKKGKGEKGEDKAEKEDRDGEKIAEHPEEKLLKVDIDGIQNRIIAIPIKAGAYSQLGVGNEGEIFYIARTEDSAIPPTLHKYDLKARKDVSVTEMDRYVISADGKKMLYSTKGKMLMADLGKKPEAGKGMINIDDVQVKIEPAEEWPQIFNEVWRINRDYFYDPGMHGADWGAMKVKYAEFLPDISCRSDLNRLIQWMCSELAVGHHRVGGGDRLHDPEEVDGGLLGADFEVVDNRYRIRKIFEGLNWNPELRSPLTEPGVNVNVNEYILAVNGRNLTAADNIYSFFENSAGRIVELTVGPNPDASDSRVVKVVPVKSESALRNRDWVEGNLKKVTEATNGQVAYVYVPNTTNLGHEYFKRYFFPQANRKAIIVDERFNGGGQLADYYVDILSRPYQAYWNTRYCKDLKTPSASIQGPKVMLIDESAGSGGDFLPWMFRKFGVGKLIGKRTWGGLVGTLGFPGLLDGGYVTAPNLGIWTEDGFVVENVGVSPDIKVEQWPAEVIKGNDPQLEKAIEVVMEELRKNPPKVPVRPLYPVRVRH